MNDPFITAVNAQNSALAWYSDLSISASNIYTPGYREKRMMFSDYINGSDYEDLPSKSEQGKSLPGNAPTNMFIEGKGMFVVQKPDGNIMYTRLGDFKFDPNGTFVTGTGYKLQGYLTDEKGNIVNSGSVQANQNGSPNNPSHSDGGPGHAPTTEINLWLDPTNGKFFGKYDEYKVLANGTVLGVADKGKTTTPLYKIALVNFINPEQLTVAENNYYAPSKNSGEPVEGTGEIRSGLIEKSNVTLREVVNYLQEAKLQLDVSAKLISTNKNLLQESLRLIQ
jgi:flagellar hook protein FlgE